MLVVVGLGNPGRRYVGTRHNVGFKVVETLAHRWSIQAESKQFGALVGTGRIGDARALLARPQGFMNRSGQPVASLAGYYKTLPESVIVVHDDLDVPFGAVRVKRSGGHGGHNGLRDIAKHIGPDFARVRVGLGRPPEGWDSAAYVLGRWTPDECKDVPHIVDTAADAVEAVLRDGVDAAMNVFNVRARSGQADAEQSSRTDERPEEQ
jgi:PTH1 family peptidyl-tRNA hydrolase